MWNYQNEIILKSYIYIYIYIYIYTHTMDNGTLIRFLSWAALTFSWLEANRLFFNAIANTINEHNEQTRLKTVENCFKLIAKPGY